MWRLLDTYREFIVNGLDFLSFLLITPQLLRFVDSTLTTVLGIFLGIMLLVFGLITMGLLSWLIMPQLVALKIPFVGNMLISVTIVMTIIIAPFYIMLIYVWGPLLIFVSRKADRGVSWTIQHAFVMGVFSFIASRSIAFAAAVHSTFF
jgi:hypothetical protein